MQGKILGFSIQKNYGVIVASNGIRYKFIGADWKEATIPTKADIVDFRVDSNNQNHATAIYLINQPKSVNPKTNSTYPLVSIFLAVAAAVIATICILFAGYLEINTEGGMSEDSFAALLIGLVIIMALGAEILAFILAVIGLNRATNKTACIIAIVISTITCLLITIIMLVGTMASEYGEDCDFSQSCRQTIDV